jgi:hypothetical protein
MFDFDINKLPLKKLGKIAAVAAVALFAAGNEILNQKKEEEFETMKKTLEILKKGKEL